MSALIPDACELCGDQGPLLLQARCHLTAPLQVSLDGDLLLIRCYLPECGRDVARFLVLRRTDGEPAPPPHHEEHQRLKEINAELLAALKHLMRYDFGDSEGAKEARAAITKAEGLKPEPPATVGWGDLREKSE